MAVVGRAISIYDGDYVGRVINLTQGSVVTILMAHCFDMAALSTRWPTINFQSGTHSRFGCQSNGRKARRFLLDEIDRHIVTFYLGNLTYNSVKSMQSTQDDIEIATASCGDI